MKAGLIGLGGMGTGMARNLAKAGFLLGVYNRTKTKAEALAHQLEIVVFDSPQSLAAQVDLVLVCVSADQDVLEMIAAVLETINPGAVVVDMSTVSGHTALQAASMLAEKQAEFLDAPVSGGVEGAKNGTLAMMVGGDPGVLKRVEPVLSAMAKKIIHMGSHGAGQAAKAANQIMCAGINQAVTEALAFAQRQGLPMAKLIEVISGGAAGNWFLERRGLTMTSGTFAPGFKLALHHKDLKICQAMAATIDFPVPVTDMTVVDYERLMADGFGDDDISGLYRLKRKS